MRHLLAIDTTAEFGSLALLREGAVVEELPMHSPDGFGHILFGRIQELLAGHQLVCADIHCFAGAAGPGSFTGVRVGLTAVKGLAEAVGCPVVGVSNLRAMASFGTGPVRAVLLDARRGEVYGAVYGAVEQPELVARFPDWLAQLPHGVSEFLAHDFGPFAAAIAACGRFADVPLRLVPRVMAGAAGMLAWREFVEGRAIDPAALDANYVRRSDAEILWKPL
jgi:tRNA threonylcarbamoyladenosine biosynthesis protein TsaB